MPKVLVGAVVAAVLAGCGGTDTRGPPPRHIDAESTAACFRKLPGYIEPEANGSYMIRPGIAVDDVARVSRMDATFPGEAGSDVLIVKWYLDSHGKYAQLQLFVTPNGRGARALMAAQRANDRQGGATDEELRRDEYPVSNAFFLWDRTGHTAHRDRQARGCLRG
jgi:hypothetical protein